MASKPGLLYEWPWTPLGSFKYVVLAPWAIHYTHAYLTAKDSSDRNLAMFLIFPFMLFRILHNQIWISLSRYRTANGKNRIVDKAIEFEQIDRERNWDDNIIFNGIIFYALSNLRDTKGLPLWKTDGVIISILLHAGPVEFLYYWLHRALHHHFLYTRYHQHHHSSVVTEPITSVIHPFGEHIAYFLLFAIPMATTFFSGTASIVSFAGYITFIDFMNNMGHCNFELIPDWLFSVFPPLKYLMYTPTFHSLHHTQFRTNYSLFMPIYDYIYGTMDKSTDDLYEASRNKQEDLPDVVHLTHLTTPESVYHLRIGFASLASKPQEFRWYFWLLWPFTFWSALFSSFYSTSFLVERNVFKGLKLQTRALPKYSIQYLSPWQKKSINVLLEEAILKAEEKGAKVLSLGLLNQEEELNGNGEMYIRKHPSLKVKLIDGSSLAAAIVVNSIPKGTTEVVLTGNPSKVACSIASSLLKRGIQVCTLNEETYIKLKGKLNQEEVGSNLFMGIQNHLSKVWITGSGLTEEEQMKALKGTTFIPFSYFPLKKLRKDCYYHYTPSMLAPKDLENLDSCENWLPRRVMSAPRIAGIVHGLEKWDVNECGEIMFDMEKIWEASLGYGFLPLIDDLQFS